MRNHRPLCLLLTTFVAGCGSDPVSNPTDARPSSAGFGDAKAAAGVKPVAGRPASGLPPLGVAAPTELAFDSGAGQVDYQRAVAALAAEPVDWVSVRSATAAALAKDPSHLDARWLAGVGQAQAGDFAAAAQHLRAAIIADPVRFAPRVDKELMLRRFLASGPGVEVRAFAAAVADEVRRRVTGDLLMVARRGRWKRPEIAGVTKATPGGELYAWDTRGSFIRLTHTDHTVAGWMRGDDGEIVYVTFDRVTMPAWDDNQTPVNLDRARVATLSLATLEAASAPATFNGVRGLAVGRGVGGELVVTTYAAAGRWGIGGRRSHVIDRQTGAATTAPAQVPTGEELYVDFDRIIHGRPATFVAGVAAEWQGSPPSAPELVIEKSGITIELPDDLRVLESSIAWSPGKERLVAATVADPCATNPSLTSSSLYAVDATSGTLTHIATAPITFAVTWLDDDRFVYEDGKGALRIYDVELGREVDRYAASGAALHGLGAAKKMVCPQVELALR